MPYLFMSATDVNSLKLCDKVGIGQAANSTAVVPEHSGARGVAAASGAGGAVVALVAGLMGVGAVFAGAL
jgi:hypothetical protein